MSNIYITEPPTEGKLIFETSFGEIDVELWPQQAPLACRNFIQHALDGYYDNTIFHRLIPNFMIQGGDPSGTGKGGKSIFPDEKPFKDEFHSRLKFNHRGLLAMANENQPHTNHSQFFFTLDACEFLNKKHTIFGKITGNTIFNLLTVNDLETTDADRPLEPPILKSIKVLWNPFDDLFPRAQVVKKQADPKPKKKARKVTKNASLLSFGEEEEMEMPLMKFSKQVKSVHDDALQSNKRLSKEIDPSLQSKIAKRLKQSKPQVLEEEAPPKSKADFAESLKASIRSQRLKHAQAKEQQPEQIEEIDPLKLESERVEAEMKKKKEDYEQVRRAFQASRKATPVLKPVVDEMLSAYEQRRSKYRKQKQAYGDREKATLAKLKAFESKLKTVATSVKQTPDPKQEDEGYAGEIREMQEITADDDELETTDWMVTKLKFKKHIDDQFRANFQPTADDYISIDTRQKRGVPRRK